METIYRKVILNIVDRCFHMYASDYRKEAKESAIEMLEEIPDHTVQIKSDNEELLELRSTIKEFRDKANQSADNLHKRGLQSSGMCSQAMETAYNLCLIEIESLIQKMKP